MELELQRTGSNGFQTVLERTVVQEETLEGIVPDVCPDMMRVVDAAGQVYVNTRETSEGTLRVGGTVRVTVLYIPEGEDGPRHTEFAIPFVCTLDDPELHSGCRIHAAPRLVSVDSRALNPRKLLIRAELLLELRVYAPESCEVCTGAVCRDSGVGLQQRIEEYPCEVISALTEKAFAFSDVLDFPVSHADANELLHSRLEARNLDAKIIGGKLILKGEVELNALCRSASGSVFVEQFRLPYSQVVELNGTGESGEPRVDCLITALECSLQPGTPASLAVTLELLAEVAVRERRTVSLLTDLYSTHSPLEVERETLCLRRKTGSEERRESVRQFCECGIPAQAVIDTAIAVGRMVQTQEANAVSLRVETNVTTLFLSEDNALCSVTYPIPVVSTLNTSEGGTVLAQCAVNGAPTAVPVSGGLEVRFDLDVAFRTVQTECCSFVNGVRELPPMEESGPQPSIILRVVHEQEELWDIAKAYHSTVDDIMAANGLEQASAPTGQLLLIPRCR